jgi:ABC-type branched-subunit amino acid transport system substrate-binding protein
MSGVEVFFFGGFRASEADMKVWQDSAEGQRPGVTFHTFPWPPAAPSDDPTKIVNAFKDFNAVVRQIDESDADVVYVVGHSSGAAIAKAIQHKVKNQDQVVLVDLDGFAPDRDQLGADQSTQVWVANNAAGKKSMNSSGLDTKRFADNIHRDTAPFASTPRALHFSLVNAIIDDERIHRGEREKNWTRYGYRPTCVANLSWLPPTVAKPK